MIHEGKLNDALNRLFFPHFHSPQPHTPPFPHLRLPPESITYRLRLPDSQFISRYYSLCLCAMNCPSLSPSLSLSFFLSLYLSILFICLPVHLPSCLSCHFFYFLTNHLIAISPTGDISNLGNAFWRFIKILSPIL